MHQCLSQLNIQLASLFFHGISGAKTTRSEDDQTKSLNDKANELDNTLYEVCQSLLGERLFFLV